MESAQCFGADPLAEMTALGLAMDFLGELKSLKQSRTGKGGVMALDLVRHVLFALGTSELAACSMVAVPFYFLVVNLLDVAQELWMRLWT